MLLQQYLPFTVLKQIFEGRRLCTIVCRLQQYLPFTVLKRSIEIVATVITALQQYLPFTVLKPMYVNSKNIISSLEVATVLTVYGIETLFQQFRELGKTY